MTFLVAAALSIALLVALPIVAHLLRRGRVRKEPFPPAALVPVARPVAPRRGRLEDRALLAVRALTILAVTALGATPLVRCSRLSLARSGGASVALAIVLDDSLSMRARLPEGSTRFSRARRAARELLDSARSGDAVALVLAGRPARFALSATTDLAAAERALEQVEPSDRSGDLAAATKLAEASLRALPHSDKRIVVLSDLAAEPLPAVAVRVWTPLPELRQVVADCGIADAERHGKSVTARIACTGADAARARTLELVAATSEQPAPSTAKVLAKTPLPPSRGKHTLELALDQTVDALEVRLSGSDALDADDWATVATQSAGLRVGVVADPSTASVSTGGATVVEQALVALDIGVSVQPLPLVPDDPKEFRGLGAFVLDDPVGLTPESRAALVEWLERGGVALAFLGPSSERVPLGSSLLPFADGSVNWAADVGDVGGADVKSFGWLGESAAGLAAIAPKGRILLETARPKDAKVVGRFDDGRPMLLERRLGKGLVWTFALPVSVDQSDLALRPAFLALLAELVENADRRAGSSRSVAGEPWIFSEGDIVIDGPEGRLDLEERTVPDAGSGAKEFVAVPAVHGRYRLASNAATRSRVATIEADEILAAPRSPKASAADGQDEPVPWTDTSAELAVILIGLVGLELALRLWGRFGPHGRTRPARA